MLRKQKWIHLTDCYSCFLLYHFWLYFKYGNPRKVICACKWNLWGEKEKGGGCFFILLCVFFHLRSKFGGPSSALVSTVGNFVCWLVCSHYYSNANEFVASPSCSKSLKCRQNVLPSQGMLCCACRVPQGDVGVPPSQRSCTAGPEGNALLWVKERR